jgi:protein TonB
MEVKKNESANLEKKRGGFFWIGMLLALSVVLLAFEHKVYEITKSTLGKLQLDLLEEEIIPVSQLTPPPPPPPPAPTTVIEIVDDEEDIEEIEIMDMEVDDNTEVEIMEMPEEEIGEEEIFTIVEKMPEFPGGTEAMYKYLSRNTSYPSMASDAGIQGVVYVTFVIEKTGKITDVRVLRGIGGGCDQEAVRVVKSMKSWTPGKQRGKPVRVQFNLPYRFTLE